MTQTEAQMLVGNTIVKRCVKLAGCFVWMGARTSAGYGLIVRRALSPAPLYVHRVVWTSFYGPIPEGKFVCHHCDNPPCVLLDHLFLGDDQANTDDKMKKGRHRHGHLYGDAHPMRKHPEWVKRGEQHGRVKLTKMQVEQIRLRSSENAAALGQEFGVTRHAINGIRSGKTWKNKKD